MKPNRMILLVALMFTVVGSVWAQDAPKVAADVAVPAACLPGDPYDLAALTEVISRPTPPSTPIAINEHITVAFVRSGTMSDLGDDNPDVGGPQRGSHEPSEPPVRESRFDGVPLRIFNTRTKFEYRVSMSDEMLKTITACHDDNGLTEAGGPGDFTNPDQKHRVYLPMARKQGIDDIKIPLAPAAMVGPMGWSDGKDTRVLQNPTTLWPWRTITQMSSWPSGEQSSCTLTLIGPRHLITAAHCLVPFGTNNWGTAKLIPARDGIDSAPYGVSQMTPTPPEGKDAWYIVPDPWLDPTTPTANNAQYQYDIGLVLMVDRLGDKTGWMGYGAYSTTDLNSREHLNRGYPSCRTDWVERPAGCQKARLYGDTEDCEINNYYNVDANNWNQNFSFGCDISRGHSGSALYHYRTRAADGKQIPVVTAVVSWHSCLTCTESDDYPNHARRVTPWVLGRISWLRETFP